MSEETTSPEGSSENPNIVDENPAPSTTVPHFFTASVLKLIVMSVCTMGIYQLYWFYKNWKLIKDRTGQKIRPFWRAFFSPLWAYSCFKEIKVCAGECKIQESLPIGLLVIAYFLLCVTWRLHDPGNWTVTEDGLADESVRYLFLETAGDNFVSIQIYPATEALELLEYAQWYADTAKEEIPIGSWSASQFSGIEGKDGNEVLTEQLEMTVLGESIPYTRIYSRKRAGNVIAFISLQTISEEYEMVVGGFDQIIASLSYEGP